MSNPNLNRPKTVFQKMNCEEVRSQLVFYGYGELASAVEEKIEAHLEICPECQAEHASQSAFLAALDDRAEAVDPSLLVQCRNDLRAAIGDRKPGKVWSGWLDWLNGVSQIHIPFRIPVGALALVALGFFGARYTPERFGGVRAGAAEPMFSSVRSVDAGVAGNVEIAVDDVRRRVVSGSLQDPAIQQLLLAAVREEANPGVRVESIGALGNGGDNDQVMRALVDAVMHDPDAGGG